MSELNPEKLDHLARFISLLTGELDVRVVSSDSPEAGAVVLPPLDSLDDASVEVLYGLCLREAGYIAKSRKTVACVARLKTERELQAAMLAEGARVERFLIRKFGGGAEILEEHFSKWARDPRFSKIVLGVDPSVASDDEVFLYAMKWNLLGRPRWGWETLFNPQQWSAAVAALNEAEFDEILAAPQRKFEDAVEVGVRALDTWLRHRRRADTSPRREKPTEHTVWEEALNDANTRLATLAQQAQDKIDQRRQEVETTQQKLTEEEERIAPQADPLRAQLAGLKKDNQKYKEFSHQLERYGRLERQRAKTDSRAQQESEKITKITERAEKMQDPSELVDVLDQRIQAVQDKRDALHAKASHKEEKIQKQIQQLQKKELDLTDKINSPKVSAERKETLEQRLATLMEQIDQLQKDLETLQQETREKIDALEQRVQKTTERAQQRLEASQEKMDGVAEKLRQAQEALKETVQQKEQLQQQMNELAREMQSKLGRGESAEQALEKMMGAHQQMEALDTQLETIEADRNALRAQLRAQREGLRAEQRAENWKMEQELQKIEQAMEQAGMPLNLTEKMVEMEGWDAANTAQREFDTKASSEYQMSVINGCGGGRGTRDVTLAVAELTSAIEDMDPNLIFADVARMSPLSGFSEGGVREAENGSVNTHAPKSASMTDVGTPRHTVWSRKWDKVLPSPHRSAKHIAQLRTQHARDIAAVKKVFAQHLKPSFKPKFVGGKEEGSLDARNMWKLAANQGEDFFEVVHKRPHNKTAATILVDLSGSCASWGEDMDDASHTIQALALMLSDGLASVNIPHEVLGYCAPLDEHLSEQSIPSTYNRKTCRLETVVAKSFKDKDVSGLAGLVVQQADNSDGESLRIAVDRLSKQHGQNKMLFMISDGKPYMQDADPQVLDNDLRLAMVEAANKKIVVSCLGLSREHAVLGDAYLSLNTVADLPVVLKDVLTKN